MGSLTSVVQDEKMSLREGMKRKSSEYKVCREEETGLINDFGYMGICV